MVRSKAEQAAIAADLGVRMAFDAAAEADERVAFLADFIQGTLASSLILAVSGGVDSAVAGMLCRRATRSVDGGAAFVAVRLPYGRQLDEADAATVLAALEPDDVFSVDIKPASDAAMAAVANAGVAFANKSQQDFVLGNIKARQRMIVQYAMANALAGRVVGTDHAAEALTGFFTKYGDGGVDVNPLAGLTKRRVRALGDHLGLPKLVVQKTPTADLESLRPQLSDEEALGVTYDQIDDFLEGREVDATTADLLTRRYVATAHKRSLPPSPGALRPG